MVSPSTTAELDGMGQLERGETIGVLPDDALLDIFKFYVDYYRWLDRDNAWQTLVHVCRRWRQVVFASPRRLNLRILCKNITPVEELLDIWPALPIVIDGLGSRGTANIDAALEYNDRVCKITIDAVSNPLLYSMKKPFPALTSLELWSYDNWPPVLPDSFLGGSAPRLRNLELHGLLFPGLPKLLLSAHHLVHLLLLNIPGSGFISPEAMVTCLSSLTNLDVLALGFRSCPPQTNQHRPPLTCTVLPSLTSLSFKGAREYLEDLVARIDVPLLNYVNITFFNQQIFDTPLLRSFISRTEVFQASHRAEISFYLSSVEVTLLQKGRADLRLGISCKPSDGQLSSIARVCNSSLPSLPTLERLDIWEYQCVSRWQDDDLENTQWLELLHPFIAVKSLYLDKKIVPRVALALQGLAGEKATEVLPALQNICVPLGPVQQQAIAQFIAARGLLGHPVAVQSWDGKRLY